MPDSKDIANNTTQGLPSEDAGYRSSLRRINSLAVLAGRLRNNLYSCRDFVAFAWSPLMIRNEY